MAEKTYIQIGGQTIDASSVRSMPDRKFREAWKLVGDVIVLDQDKLPQVKARLKKAVDEAAEAERLKYITPGFGQMLAYTQKLQEAQAVQAGEADPANVPVLAASVGIEAVSLQDCAALVLAKWNLWRGIANKIEIARLAAKKAIDAAQTIEAADLAAMSVRWPKA